VHIKACSALCALLLAACTTHADGTRSTNKTAVGAGVGAVAGGVLGNRLDKDKRARGTVIGAAAGAAAGAGRLSDGPPRGGAARAARERAHRPRHRAGAGARRSFEVDHVQRDFDSAAIKPAFKPTMSKLAEVLKKYDGNEITIIGHTDALGSEAYNQQLSEQRAVAVRKQLVTLGVPASSLRAFGRELEPRADNGSEAGRQVNRRVEILVQTTS
jgi:outer membrane protein OmpA-like peptidoglycan-associated protein